MLQDEIMLETAKTASKTITKTASKTASETIYAPYVVSPMAIVEFDSHCLNFFFSVWFGIYRDQLLVFDNDTDTLIFSVSLSKVRNIIKK